jgi:hypothetical protein
MLNEEKAIARVPDRHTHSATHREQILEHHFVADLLRYLWKHHHDEDLPEVTYSDVDNSGYDLVIEWRGVQRHIQLKSSISTTSPVRMNASLSRKPSGCVVLMECNADLSAVLYRWLGNSPQQRLDFTDCKRAKHTRANSEGIKRESISAVKVPRGRFQRFEQIGDLVAALFPALPENTLGSNNSTTV